MTRTSAWLLGAGASGVAAYGIWRAWQNRRVSDLPWARGPRSRDEMINEASEESFPASDAPSHTPMIGSKATAY